MNFKVWDPSNRSEEEADVVEYGGYYPGCAARRYAKDIDYCKETFESKDYLVRALDEDHCLYRVRILVALEPTFRFDATERVGEESR